MPRLVPSIAAIAWSLSAVTALAEAPSGDAKQGAQLYRACAACHSLTAERNMTGPSLAGVWGRRAGSLPSFERYSSALRASNILWDEQTLDAWLKAPSRLVPSNNMSFAGISSEKQRADLIAFLKEANSGAAPAAEQGGGMGAMMGSAAPNFTDLKALGPERQVASIRICHDSYFVTTADGKAVSFWEPNLRFKTDSSGTGPLPGKPVIVPAGMMGDRASVFFAVPDEISPFIKHQC